MFPNYKERGSDLSIKTMNIFAEIYQESKNSWVIKTVWTENMFLQYVLRIVTKCIHRTSPYLPWCSKIKIRKSAGNTLVWTGQSNAGQLDIMFAREKQM